MDEPCQSPTVPQLILGLLEDVLSGLEEATRAAGYDDVRIPHFLHVFRFLTIEGARPADLARRAGITQQSMGELIAHLERHGYVTRVPDPTDRRARIVIYADRGLEGAAAVQAYFADLESRWASQIGTDAMDAIRHALGTLADTPAECS